MQTRPRLIGKYAFFFMTALLLIIVQGCAQLQTGSSSPGSSTATARAGYATGSAVWEMANAEYSKEYGKHVLQGVWRNEGKTAIEGYDNATMDCVVNGVPKKVGIEGYTFKTPLKPGQRMNFPYRISGGPNDVVESARIVIGPK